MTSAPSKSEEERPSSPQHETETSSLSDSDATDQLQPHHPLRIHRQISLPPEFKDANQIKSVRDIDAIAQKEARWRLKAQIFFLSSAFQTWLMVLIIFDLLCVLADLIVLLVYCELDEEEPHGVEIIVEIIEVLSIIILCLFEIEFMIQIWAFGINWFKQCVHIFDVIVVTSTLVLEIVFFSNPEVETIIGLLVLLRLWRLFRVVYVTAEALELKIEEKHHNEKKLRKENRRLKKELLQYRNANNMDQEN